MNGPFAIQLCSLQAWRSHLLLVIKIDGCFVTNILTHPIDFATGSSQINVNRPIW
jgi:hypothetical protein